MLFAQDFVQIKITGESDEALIGAYVLFIGENTKSYGTVSDLDGLVKIPMQNLDGVEVSYIGYEKETFAIQELSSLKEVRLSPLTLDPIVVVSYSTSMRTRCCCVCSAGVISEFIIEEETIVDPFPQKSIPEWTVYPNPTVDIIHIQGDSAEGKIEVVSPNGQVISTLDLANEVRQVDLSNWPNGSYFLRFLANERTEYVGTVIKADIR